MNVNMRPWGKVGVVALVALSATMATPQGISEARQLKSEARSALERNPNVAYSPVTLIVKFEKYTSENQRAFARAQARTTKIASTRNVEGIEVLGTRMGVERAVEALNRMPWVEYAELDYTVHADVIPNDQFFGVLWGLHNTGQSGGTVDADIDAPEAWDIFTGSPNTIVAVIDTGVERTHADLSAQTWTNPGEIAGNGVDDDGNGYVDDVYGYDFYNNDNNPIDDHGHGTHTAGTIGASGNNTIGVTGVNWQVKIAALKFLGSNGSGSTSDAVLAVDYCVTEGIKVSNNSWGGGGFDQSLFDAIQAAQSIGHIFVAAAGNGGPDQIGDNNDAIPHYPSSYNLPNLIAVAATDRFDNRSGFSNYGATSVDLGAPGTDIGSTYINGQYVYSSGTSMATPHVTGAVALLMGYRTDFTWQQVRDTIFNTVRPTSAMNGITVTGGVLNLKAMLDAATPVSNSPPSVSISSPADGGSSTVGDSVAFSGTANDVQDGDLSSSLSWSSSIDGTIGSGASFSTSSLSVGTHTITASVTDSGGLQGSASITFTVNPVPPPNTAPTVTITSPADGTSVTQGTSISFAGTADDNEDGNLSANLAWTSSLDGAIGNGASFSTAGLSVGTHTITAGVTDSGGMSGSDSITVTVNAPPSPPATPTGFKADKQGVGVALLSWNDVANEDGYTIERQVKVRNGWTTTATFNVGANATSTVDSPGRGTFRYRIRSFNGFGASAWSGYSQVKL